MKSIYLILIISFGVSCMQDPAENTTVIGKSNSEASQSLKKQSQENDKLVGTWFVKELLINGKPDPENFPVNNDEFTLNKDMTVTSIDRTFNREDKGTWERISNDQFAVITEDDERVLFQILKLTESELETKMLTDEIDMVINYKKEK